MQYKFKTKDIFFKSVILDISVLCFSLGGQTSKLCKQCYDFPSSEWAGMLSIALRVAGENLKLTHEQKTSIEHAQELLNCLNDLLDNISPEEINLNENILKRYGDGKPKDNILAFEIYELNKLLKYCREEN